MNRISLIAYDPTICNKDFEARISSFITKHGGWAAWWSFPIRKEILKPFFIYISEGKGKITYRFTVQDYATKKGNDGIVSPWQKITEPLMKGRCRAHYDENRPAKTWFYTTEFRYLNKSLSIDDFTPVVGSKLIYRSTFGYGKRNNVTT